jgi:tRNA-guanine family transglycosylase
MSLTHSPSPRVLNMSASVPQGCTLTTPILWLGQNLKNRVLPALHAELDRAPMLVSLGDAYLRPTLIDRFFNEDLRGALGMRGPIMVDSGGFTLLSRRTLRSDIRSVERIYSRLRADIVVSLDHPPSLSDDRPTRARRRARTVANLDRLCNVVPLQRLMPVVHGLNLEDLRRACDGVYSICPEPRQIGVGGLVALIRAGGAAKGFEYSRDDGSSGDSADLVADTLGVVRRSFPRAMVHLFGVGSTTTAIAALALGADSVDSLGWRRAAAFGTVLLPGRSERFPTFDPRRLPSRPVVAETEFPLVEACKCPACGSLFGLSARLQALASSYKVRAVHNAWTLLTEVKSLRTAILNGSANEFFRSRIDRRHRLYRPVARFLNASRNEE